MIVTGRALIHDSQPPDMWPRLHLLRELLAEDSVIFIYIDDNKHHLLRMMMDEIFGVEVKPSEKCWVLDGKIL